MKKIFIILIISIPLSLFSQGFNSVHSPDGVNVYAVGDLGKIYYSSDSGNNWFNCLFTSNNLKSVNSISNFVWFAGDLGKVYRSYLGMTSIQEINIGINFTINSIYFVDPNIGFLCGDGGKVYKSINGGISWNIMNSGITNEKLNSISFKDSQNGVVVGDSGKVYITNNGGINWTLETIFSNRNLLKVKYFSDGICIAGEFGTIIIKTSVFSWAHINTRTNTDIRGVSGTSINDVHVCGGTGFIRNNSSGSGNFLNFEPNPMMANLVDVHYFNTNVGFAVSSLNKVIIRTTDGGMNWNMQGSSTVSFSWIQKTPSGSGIGNNLCMHPGDRNSIFVVYGNKVYASRDKAETWTQIATVGIGTRAHSFYVSPLDTNIWLAAMESSPDCVVRSTNYGVSWTNIIAKDFSTYGQPLEMDQNDPSVYYFAPSNTASTGFYKSTDNGAAFNLVAPYNNSAIGQPCDIIVKWDDSDVIFLGDDGADIWKSTNGGLNWSLSKSTSSSEVPSMCNTVFDNSIFYATTWSSSQVYKTVNSGDSWIITSNNSGSGWASDICHEDPTLVLTGNYGSQAYLSTNSGLSFFNVNSGLGGAGAGIIVPEKDFLLNMQTSSLYKLRITYSVSDVTIIIPPSTNFIRTNLKVFPEGFYFPLFNQLSRKDTMSVYLRNSISPYSLVDSSKEKIDSLSLSGVFTFNLAPTGTYFVSLKHKNSIETWSKAGGEFLTKDGSIYNYDFSTSSSKAYGNNLVLRNGKYCLYGGDVNQDGFITLFDVIPIYNDAANFVTGRFIKTDLTGDNIVDLTDVTIGYNNSANFVTKITP